MNSDAVSDEQGRKGSGDAKVIIRGHFGDGFVCDDGEKQGSRTGRAIGERHQKFVSFICPPAAECHGTKLRRTAQWSETEAMCWA